MADDYVRETLRTLRERTGDAYVPLSEVLGLAAELRGMAGVKESKQAEHARNGFSAAYNLVAGQADALNEAAWLIERRWGPACGDCCESEPAMDSEAARG